GVGDLRGSSVGGRGCRADRARDRGRADSADIGAGGGGHVLRTRRARASGAGDAGGVQPVRRAVGVLVPGELLRTGLLQGTALLVAGAGAAPVAKAIEAECAQLGARAAAFELDGAEDVGAAALAATEQLGALDLLALDAGSVFAAGAAERGARAALDCCLQVSWEVTRALVNAAF